MPSFEIVAHRGVPSAETPENTLPAFQRAIGLGADAVELDVRLTADGVPVLYHYFYLEEATSLSGPVFAYTLEQLRERQNFADGSLRISTLGEVLETIGGRTGLEIEIKGPEPESAAIVAAELGKFAHLWDSIEVTSYEPMLLVEIGRRCPGLATDLLFPRSEGWMKQDVVTYTAIHRARLAQARAVHLHPTQLSAEAVSDIRRQGIEVHVWDINDRASLETVRALEIPRICTDECQQALEFRQQERPA